MKSFDRILLRLLDVTMLIAGVALAFMLVHVTADVVARVLFNDPIEGTLEIVAFYYMVAAVVAGIAYLERRDLNISVDLFYQRFPRPLRRASYVLSSLLTAIFFGLFAYRSGLDALYALETREQVMGMAEIEIWPSRFVLPISFTLVVLVALRNVVVAVTGPFDGPASVSRTSMDD